MQRSFVVAILALSMGGALLLPNPAAQAAGIRMRQPVPHMATVAGALPQPALPAWDPAAGAQDAYLPRLSDWCDGINSYLMGEFAAASMQLQARRDYATAKAILMHALQEASASLTVSPELHRPFTKSLVDRGWFVARELDQRVGDAPLELASKVKYLLDYVQFVVEVSSEFDQAYYLPYHYAYGECSGVGGCPAAFDFTAFQERFADYGRRQLEFVTGSFTEVTECGPGMTGREASGQCVSPIGDPRVFLIATEHVSRWVAEDVSLTLRPFGRACAISNLTALSSRLRGFNRGSRIHYPTYPAAVALVRSELDLLIPSLGSGCAWR